MCEVLNTPFGDFMSYDIFNNLGTVLGLGTFCILLWRKKASWRYFLAGAVTLAAIMVIGGFFSSLVRQLTHMDFQNYQELAKDVIERNGNHFLGRVLAAALFYPVIYRFAAYMLNVGYRKDQEQVCLDALAFFIPIQHFFNRLACLMNGCCYGIPYNGPFALQFDSAAAGVVNYPVFPSQAFEMGTMVILFVVVVFLYRKKKRLFGPVLIGFGISIFVSEFFMDQRGNLRLLGLNAIQYGAILLCLIGAWYVRRRKGSA